MCGKQREAKKYYIFFQIRWYFNSKFLFGEDKEILKLMNVQLKHNGVYKCVVKNEYGTVFKEINLDVLGNHVFYNNLTKGALL